MSDLITRLRDFAGNPMLAIKYAGTMTEAADEIERLVRVVDTLEKQSLIRDGEYLVEIERLTAERDALRQDAERYRWLAAHARSTSEHWGGRWSIVIEGPAPKRHDEEDSFHEAIDAAIAQSPQSSPSAPAVVD